MGRRADRPKGTVEGNGQRFQIYTNTAGRTAVDYQSLVVAWRVQGWKGPVTQAMARWLEERGHVVVGERDARLGALAGVEVLLASTGELAPPAHTPASANRPTAIHSRRL